MNEVAMKLRVTVDDAKVRLLALTDQQASAKPFADKWSIKEIIGHLVDSASNNHQRFVRMQEVRDMGAFSYEQEHWVNCQRYQTERWEDLVNMWYSYNRHLAHVIEHINPAALGNTCDIGYPKPATLQYVAEDYLRHMKHHLDEIFSGADPRQRKKWEVVQ